MLCRKLWYLLGRQDHFSGKLYHLWTSWHSLFTDSWIWVTKELFTIDCVWAHLPFSFSFLPPSHFCIPQMIHKPKQHSWPCDITILSQCHTSCLSQHSHLARGCPEGPALHSRKSSWWCHCVVLSSRRVLHYCSDTEIVIIKWMQKFSISTQEIKSQKSSWSWSHDGMKLSPEPKFSSLWPCIMLLVSMVSKSAS